MKVLCIGDSLALPRPNLNYEKTWISKLKGEYPTFDFICLFQRAVTTNVLVSGWEKEGLHGADALEFYNPEICILQLGIVDCSPRYIKSASILFKILNSLPHKLQKLCWQRIKRNKRRSIKNVDVPIEKFENNLFNYILRCKQLSVKRVILIGICNPSNMMISRNPQIRQAVNLYNNILKKLENDYDFVSLIDPLNSINMSQEIFLDGYHPNELGNELVFKSLFKELQCVKDN